MPDEQTTQTPTETTETMETTETTEEVVSEQPAETFADRPAEPEQTTEPESTTAEAVEPEPTEPEPSQDELVVPKPSEYNLPEGMPDNIRIFAHENGFTQKQLEAALNQFGGYMNDVKVSEQMALRQMGEAHLKNWGPQAKTKLALAKQALQQNDPDGALAEALETSGYGNHPAVLNFLHNIGKSMQEGGFLKSAVPRNPQDKTAAQMMYGDNHPSSN